MESEDGAAQQDATRQKSQNYLEKCVQEVTYLLTPPSHPAPRPQLNQHDASPNPAFSNQQLPAPSLEEVYLQQSQKDPPLHRMPISHMSPSMNHQPPPAPSIPDEPSSSQLPNQSYKASYMARTPIDQQPLPQGPPLSVLENLHHPQPQHESNFLQPPDEQIERVTHSYDSYGRPVPARQDDMILGTHDIMSEPEDEISRAAADDWDFNEPQVPEQPPEPPPPRRPDTDAFPTANHLPSKSPPRAGPSSHRRKGSMSRRKSDERRRSSDGHEIRDLPLTQGGSHMKADSTNFRVRFALRGHLDVVRSVIFTGGGSPSEPEICTAGDDGVIKRWIIPASFGTSGPYGGTAGNDLDIQSYFTHRGHAGVVTSLAACPASQNFSNGGRALGDGWIFSGGQDATVRVWERGRVDQKATLDGHTDAIWTVCVLPASSASVFGVDNHLYGGPDRIILASGSSDGTVKIWAVSAPPQLSSPLNSGSRRGVGGSRRHSVTTGSNFPTAPQPSTATTTPFHYSLIHTIVRPDTTSPTCISPLSMTGDSFVVSYTDASVLIFDTRTGEEVIGMASLETWDGTPATGVNAVVATSVGLDGGLRMDSSRTLSEDEGVVHGATGSSGGVEGVVISGHEDRYIRFFDANSGQCTYTMLAHPSAISSLSLSPDGRELVSAGHDASLRFWSLEKRSCTQEITSHRLMRGEGVCAVVWSQDGRWVVSGGGDGVVKVFARSPGAIT
ncbi:MAG: pro11 protein [Candelina mexicana]|nr:MAG: pro11 protein [Candelina mexicana]